MPLKIHRTDHILGQNATGGNSPDGRYLCEKLEWEPFCGHAEYQIAFWRERILSL